MFKTALQAFLSVPDSGPARTLIEGMVDSVEPGQVRVTFVGPIGLTEGQDATLYAEVAGRFRQQAARVAAESVAPAVEPLPAAPPDQRVTVAFDLIGESVSAEQREAYRAPAIMLNVPVSIGRLSGCTLADVSPEGIGALCPRPLPIAAMLEVAMTVDGHRIDTRMRVQTGKPLPNGKQRCGLYLPGQGSADRRSLEQLASHLQRMQLKRLSGAA